METVCKPVDLGDIAIPNKRTFASLMGVCKKFHGKVSAVTSQRMQDAFARDILSIPSCSGSFGDSCCTSLYRM